MVRTYYNITEMLHLKVIDDRYTGLYYNLVQKNLWSKKPRDKNYLKLSRNIPIVATDLDYIGYDQVIDDVLKFLESKSNNKTLEESKSVHYASSLEGIKNHGFIVAVVEGDTVCFNLRPKVHKTEASAKAEVIRLSAKFPGKHFAYFKAMGLTSVQVNWEN